MSLWSRLKNAIRPGNLDSELQEELQFHVEARTRALMDEGVSKDEAAALAAKRFGNRLRLREDSRDVKLLPWLDAVARDITFGLRRLRKDATGTIAAVVSLGFALGACVAAFSLVDALVRASTWNCSSSCRSLSRLPGRMAFFSRDHRDILRS